MAGASGVNDDTRLHSLPNPTALKRVSGDSSSGVDAPTLKALAEALAVNGMININAIKAIEIDDALRLSIEKTPSIEASRGAEKRSEFINEIALGMSAANFKSDKMSSLGDMMCELMILMIKSASERKYMESELSAVLTAANLERSREIAKKIIQDAEIQVRRIKKNVWGNLASTVVSFGVGEVSASMKRNANFKASKENFENRQLTNISSETNASVIANRAEFHYKESFESAIAIERQKLNDAKSVQGLFQSGLAISDSIDLKKATKLQEEIRKQKTILDLTRSVADSVETSLKSIDSVREHFTELMSQIIEANYDNKMKIMRNTTI